LLKHNPFDVLLLLLVTKAKYCVMVQIAGWWLGI